MVQSLLILSAPQPAAVHKQLALQSTLVAKFEGVPALQSTLVANVEGAPE